MILLELNGSRWYSRFAPSCVVMPNLFSSFARSTALSINGWISFLSAFVILPIVLSNFSPLYAYISVTMESSTEPTLDFAKLTGWPIIGVNTFLTNDLPFSIILNFLAFINCSPIFLGILSATIFSASAIRCL